MNMKKLFYLFFLISFSLFSQSKQETETWIVNKLDKYKRVENYARDLWIENNKIFYKEEYGKVSNLEIKEIKDVRIFEENLKLTSGEKIIFCSIELWCGKNNCVKVNYANSKSRENKKLVSILLAPEFKEDDLFNRMGKAIKHLIKLNGGKATLNRKETF